MVLSARVGTWHHLIGGESFCFLKAVLQDDEVGMGKFRLGLPFVDP